MIRPLLVAATLTTWAVAVAPLQAQNTQPPCQDPAYRQFDFWLGSWDVFRPDGQKAGHNDITSEMGGCVLHEHYDGAGGYHGESFNTWDPGRGVWHQTWVDNGGTLLLIEGTFSEGHMRLEGTTVGSDGSKPSNASPGRSSTRAATACASSGNSPPTAATVGPWLSTANTGACPADQPAGDWSTGRSSPTLASGSHLPPEAR